MWCIPTINAEYRKRLHDICTLYERPFDPQLPVVCLDEKSLELHDEARAPQRTRRGMLRDSDYLRRGTANVFVMTEPKGGRHFARVTKRRTGQDFAKCLKWLAARYTNAITIHLVMDNLNTHCEKSLIRAFGAQQGRRLWARFTVHYTPVHASWLNQAEIAIGVMTRCCLYKRRIPSIEQLKAIVLPFWKQRRQQHWTINWKFDSDKAKVWLKSFEMEH